MTKFKINDLKNHSHILKNKHLTKKNISTSNSTIYDNDDSNINMSIINKYTTNESIDESIDEHIDGPIDESIDEHIDSPIDKSIDGHIDEHIGESINESIDEHIGESIDNYIITSNIIKKHKKIKKGGDCRVCTEQIDNDNMTNEEFENYANLQNYLKPIKKEKNKKIINKKITNKKIIKGGNVNTYIIYGSDLYFDQLEHRLKNWKKIELPNIKQRVDFVWGNLLPNMHYDKNFFNQNAKLKNILMNSKSIISDKGKLYKTFSSFMKEGKYIPQTYDLYICTGNDIPISNKNPYIVKDATSFGQKGVHIITSIRELEKYKNKLKHTSAIISEYLINPLLWGGKKFHFRIYIGIYVSKKTGKRFIKIFNNSNYAFKVFMAKDNFIADHYHNNNIHITGRKSTIKRHQWLNNQIKTNNNDNFYFSIDDLPNGVSFSDINKNIEHMFHELIEPHLSEFEEYPECDAGFEIFGADVMLNNNGDPFILEINAKIGYSEDYGEKENSDKYHKQFSHDLFNWIYDNFIKI